MNKEPRLKFTDAERADPKLKKSINRADRAAERADTAQSKIPKKKSCRPTVDPQTGQLSVQMYSKDKKPPSKLKHTVMNLKGKSIKPETEDEDSRDDNVGAEFVGFVQETGENGVRLIEEGVYRQRKKPYENAAKAEKKLQKTNVDALYQKSMQNNTQTGSNPASKWQQKQKIKKQYAAAKRREQTAGTFAENAKKLSEEAAKEAKKAGEFLWKHRKGILIAASVVFAFSFMLSALSSGTSLVQSIGSAVSVATFPVEDHDMLSAEAGYAGMEADLQKKLDNYESTHDYDEYHYDLDAIEHDPYVLISLMTAYHQGPWKIADAQGTMQMLFDKQYILTETVETEVRYKTETRTGTRQVTNPNTGISHYEAYQYEVQVPYDYDICTVTLENFNLSHLPVYVMGEDQVALYAVYISTHGNRPDLFPSWKYPNASTNKDYTDYDIPPEALEDEQFAAMIGEAEKYLGFPYVWGGSSPSTSFDCSGYISWVINHSGWNVGRLGADSLFNLCTPVSAGNAKPGDLVFFEHTYDTNGVSHVGLYVGNNMMIHCGNPISYTNLNSKYWKDHFYAFGRLPKP